MFNEEKNFCIQEGLDYDEGPSQESLKPIHLECDNLVSSSTTEFVDIHNSMDKLLYVPDKILVTSNNEDYNPIGENGEVRLNINRDGQLISSYTINSDLANTSIPEYFVNKA